MAIDLPIYFRLICKNAVQDFSSPRTTQRIKCLNKHEELKKVPSKNSGNELLLL